MRNEHTNFTYDPLQTEARPALRLPLPWSTVVLRHYL